MTHQANCTLPVELTEKINSGGLGSLPELIQVIVNNAMQVERSEILRFTSVHPRPRAYESYSLILSCNTPAGGKLLHV